MRKSIDLKRMMILKRGDGGKRSCIFFQERATLHGMKDEAGAYDVMQLLQCSLPMA